MKLIKCLIVFLVVGIFYFVPALAKASYITLPGAAGIVDDYYNDCDADTDGIIASGGSDCLIYFPITIATGYTLSSVTAYYYDNSGSQTMFGSLRRLTLSSTSVSSTLASFTDTSTSASAQSYTMSYGSATSSSYTYYVYLWLSAGTELRGIKIYYY